MKADLTGRQRQVFEFITRSIDERGYPPTLREIGAHMRIRSTNGVNDHLKALERKGMLERRVTAKRSSRTLVVLERRPSGRSLRSEIPVLGTGKLDLRRLKELAVKAFSAG